MSGGLWAWLGIFDDPPPEPLTPAELPPGASWWVARSIYGDVVASARTRDELEAAHYFVRLEERHDDDDPWRPPAGWRGVVRESEYRGVPETADDAYAAALELSAREDRARRERSA